MEYDLDVYEFIALVEAKPVIWDSTSADFKQKVLTDVAWREIAATLCKDFGEWDEGKQAKFCTFIKKKWKNTKDGWAKSNRKRQMGQKNTKKYVYDENLKFLRKCRILRRGCMDLRLFKNEQPSTSSSTKFLSSQPILENCVAPKVDESHVLTLKESEERHVSFIKGILPSLHKFNEIQVLQFQMGVLELIQNIQITGSTTKLNDPLGEPQFVCENVFDNYKGCSSDAKIKIQDLSSSCSSFSDDSVTLD